MLMLGDFRRRLCPCGCGHLAEVSQADENEFRFVAVPARCHARTAIVKASQSETLYLPESVLFRAELRD